MNIEFRCSNCLEMFHKVWIWNSGEFVTHIITGPINSYSILSARDSIESVTHDGNLMTEIREDIFRALSFIAAAWFSTITNKTSRCTCAAHALRSDQLADCNRALESGVTPDDHEIYVSGNISIDHSSMRKFGILRIQFPAPVCNCNWFLVRALVHWLSQKSLAPNHSRIN